MCVCVQWLFFLFVLCRFLIVSLVFALQEHTDDPLDLYLFKYEHIEH